ncbi:hypothetical protein EAG_01876 [Camponotus floridanus]|uniref:Uncharacterized protein n=1 Tax=Camponotus floridanus TaxID=104421 RepID=E2ALB5_CAMFO|nr:hypothetical protein EAG_01876 [Camponotus floridanus]
MDENNMQWTRFKSTPVMPVYFIAASLVHLVFISEINQTAKLLCRTGMVPHMQFAKTVAENIAYFLDKEFPYIRKSPETNHIVIPKVTDEEDIKFGFVLYGYKSSRFFLNLLQTIMDTSLLEKKYNLEDRIVNWIQLNHYPVINVNRNYNNGNLNISVENFNTDIWIFMNITTQTHSDSKKLLPEVWLASNISYHILHIDFIDKNDWVLANLQQSEQSMR